MQKLKKKSKKAHFVFISYFLATAVFTLFSKYQRHIMFNFPKYSPPTEIYKFLKIFLFSAHKNKLLLQDKMIKENTIFGNQKWFLLLVVLRKEAQNKTKKIKNQCMQQKVLLLLYHYQKNYIFFYKTRERSKFTEKYW